MKRIAQIFILLSLSFFSYCQIATYDDVINKAKKGKLQEYISKDGISFKVGDTLTLGVPFRNEVFDYIKQNAGLATYFPVESTSSGSNVVVKKIRIYDKKVWINTTKASGCAYALLIDNIEEAIKQGEIRTSYLSSEDALKKLRTEKEKLDLGLISQDEYDKRKAELMKYIK